jgi:acetyl-CoA C-acetyltransferase
MKTVDSNTCGDFLGLAAYCEKEASGIVLPFPKLFGRLADETLNKYPDLDEKRYMDALARISVKNYANAKRNPLAQTRKWFMSFEQASTRGTPTNPLTGGRLAVSDCSQVTDGACLLVLCSAAFMRERGIRGTPELVGYGHRNAPLLFSKKMDESRSSDYLLPWTRQTVLDAYRRAALSVDDMDVFETHDCFTSSEYAAISAFGLTKPGEEYQAVESGLIAFDGAKPINPSGGLIGCGHPVGASGARMMLDLYKQLTGTAGAYQVKGARNGMMLNFGGSATTNYAFVLSMRDRAGLEGCPWR